MLAKKPENNLILPDMVKNITPVTLPQMQFNQGLIPGFFHNRKLNQMAKEAKFQAEIAENKNRAARAWLDTIQNFQTYMVRTELVFKQTAHAERMMEQEFIEKNLKNQLLHYEVEKAKFEHSQMMREAENDETVDG